MTSLEDEIRRLQAKRAIFHRYPWTFDALHNLRSQTRKVEAMILETSETEQAISSPEPKQQPQSSTMTRAYDPERRNRSRKDSAICLDH